jgi:uncharacterized protein (DUF1330 family)
MPKGYWIPHIDVSDPEGYKAYMAATPAAHEKYGGRALVRGGTPEVVEGKGRSRSVVREFPDYATALACYRSPEYQRAKPLRLAHSVCDFVIIEGYDGGQPPPLATPSAAASRKGYWIAHVDVTEPEGYKAYMAADMVPFGKVRARTVVLEFPSYPVALDCYRSADYQAAAALRKGKADFDLIIIEGCEAQAS